ncbi:hypothetical protein D3C81_2197900 [compost metagenome]
MKVALRLTIRLVLVMLEDWKNSVEVAIADCLNILETGFKVPLIEIIKEQSTDTTLFVTVF